MESQKPQSWYLVLDCDLDQTAYIPGHAEKWVGYTLKFLSKYPARQKKNVFKINFTLTEKRFTNKGCCYTFVDKIQVKKWWFAGIICLPFNVHNNSGPAKNYHVTERSFLSFLMQIYCSIHSFISLSYQSSQPFHYGYNTFVTTFLLLPTWYTNFLLLHINYIKLNSSTCFERNPLIIRRSTQIVHMQPLVSSLSASDRLVQPLRHNKVQQHLQD